MAKQLELLRDEVLEEAAECLKVMAHPVRLKMVNILMQGEFAVHEIAELCRTSANQTCEHLRLLKRHGLLSSERRGRTAITRSCRRGSPRRSSASLPIVNRSQCVQWRLA